LEEGEDAIEGVAEGVDGTANQEGAQAAANQVDEATDGVDSAAQATEGADKVTAAAQGGTDLQGGTRSEASHANSSAGSDLVALVAAGNDCQLDTAWVVGWITLRVDFVGKSGSDLFLETTYLGPTTGNGLPGSEVPDFGMRAIRLVD
jgi:hypothetical protein